jgi:hypothetical protein
MLQLTSSTAIARTTTFLACSPMAGSPVQPGTARASLRQVDQAQETVTTLWSDQYGVIP